MPTICKPGYVINPKTNRCIKADGKIAKQLGLVSKVAPKKVTPKKVSPKKVSLKKVSPKKVSLKKVSPKKVSLKKVSPKKVVPTNGLTVKLVSLGGEVKTYTLPEKLVQSVNKIIAESLKITFLSNKNFPKELIKKYNLDTKNEDEGLFAQLERKAPAVAKKIEADEEAKLEKHTKIQDKARAEIKRTLKITDKEASHILSDMLFRYKGLPTLHDQPSWV